MATAKATEKKSAADEPVVVEEAVAAPAVDALTDPRACVVDDGTAHTGRAVNGVVCSAHANRYKADGTPRGQ